MKENKSKINKEFWNAKITEASISMADHGCLTFTIFLEGSGRCCGFGGYSIGSGYLGAKEFSASGDGLEAMMRIMDTVGVEKWEDLIGKYVRVVDPEWGGIVTCIGHVTKEKWFDIKEFFTKKSEGKQQNKKPIPKNVDELREFVGNALKEQYEEVHLRTIDQDIVVHVEEYHNGRNDVWIQFPYFHSR